MKMIYREDSKKVISIRTICFNIMDLGIYGCLWAFNWVKHPVLNWNLYYGKQRPIPLANFPHLSVKFLSNKHSAVAVYHKDFPDIVYSTHIYPDKQEEAVREIVRFYQAVKALDQRKNPDNSTGTTYSSSNF